MYIASLAHELPKTRLSNDDVIAILKRKSRANGDFRPIERWLRKSFAFTGTEQRHIALEGESLLDMAAGASRQAIARAGFGADDIDLVIFTSVSRGWLEPATAVFLQRALCATNATSFDVLDACAGWLRGLEIADGYLRSGRYRTALIVAAEGGMQSFAELDLNDLETARRHFATFTIGEGAAACVVTAERPDNFAFTFKTFPEGCDLAMLPLGSLEGFAPGVLNGAGSGGKFYADSNALIAQAVDHMVETFKADPALSQADFDICFNHAASMKANEMVAEKLGLTTERLYATHARFGNSVAASVPLAMSAALDEGRLERGQKIMVMIGSAGITVGFAKFVF